ncbi:MAG: hypothetical protein HY337_05430 [Gemmatimonadetes bacterium]|nr:hypothetical protein [Gemmatimonadota bacterium]
MRPKTDQLQIRVTPEQKRTLKRLAREAGADVSSWVLGQVLPVEADRFQALVARVADPASRRYALAELADWLRKLPAGAFRRAVSARPAAPLDGETLNYLAAAIDLAASRRGLEPPRWVEEVPVRRSPTFGSALSSVRLYLLTRSPVALRRRNVFADASVDDRV